MAQQYSVAYGEERIGFSVRYLPRPTGRVAGRVSIHVMPDGSVQVDAPEGCDLAAVKRVVRDRARWVWQQLESHRARQRHVLPREYISGETHFYLGRRHVLKVRHVAHVAHAAPAVRMWRGRLEVSTAQRDGAVVRGLLDAWYRARAQEVLGRVLADVAARTRLGGALPPWRLRTMRTQWGSCSPAGALIFNPHLVKASKACIEYVVAHELCHLREHHHGPRFYRLLSAVMPDWAQRKTELDGLAEQLLNR